MDKIKYFLKLFPLDEPLHFYTDTNYFLEVSGGGVIFSKSFKLNNEAQQFYLTAVNNPGIPLYTISIKILGEVLYFMNNDGSAPLSFSIRNFIKDDPNQFFRIECGGFDKPPFFDNVFLGITNSEPFYRIKFLTESFLQRIGVPIMIYSITLTLVWAIKDESILNDAQVVLLPLANVSNNHKFILQPSEITDYYYIYCVHSGKYLQLQNDGISDGVALVQSDKRCNRDNQLFQINKANQENGFAETDLHSFIHYQSGKSLTVYGGSYSIGDEIKSYYTADGHNYKFKIVKI